MSARDDDDGIDDLVDALVREDEDGEMGLADALLCAEAMRDDADPEFRRWYLMHRAGQAIERAVAAGWLVRVGPNSVIEADRLRR